MNRLLNITAVILTTFFCLFITSCKKVTPAAVLAGNYSLSEQFDSISEMQTQGWVFINNSRALGTATWEQGDPTIFTAYTSDYTAADYVCVDAQCAYPFDSLGNFTPNTTVSAWMLTPVLHVKNGDQLNFYTSSTYEPPVIPDRLEVRVNPTGGSSADVGSDSSSVGAFTQIVLDINPNLLVDGYPNQWTEYQFTVSGFPTLTATRFAFRYYKPIYTLGYASYYYDLGYIGIDDFNFVSN